MKQFTMTAQFKVASLSDATINRQIQSASNAMIQEYKKQNELPDDEMIVALNSETQTEDVEDGVVFTVVCTFNVMKMQPFIYTGNTP